MSEEASCDEVVVFDTSEREGDVDCSRHEALELRDFIGWGWCKREEGTQYGGGGFGIRVVRAAGNKGGEKVLVVRRGWRVGLWGEERAEIGWPRKRGGVSGVFVAPLRGGVGLWSLCTGGQRKKW